MDPREAALFARLRWLIGLRWLAAAAVVSLSTSAAYLFGFHIGVRALQVLGVTIAAYNCGFVGWLHVVRRSAGPATRRHLNLCASAQISVDLLALVLVVHYTGGLESPLSLFFVFHMIIASTILSREAAYGQATLVLGLYGAVVVLEGGGRIGHYHLGIGALPDMYKSPEAWPVLAVVTTTLYVSVYLTSTIVGELRRREEQLATLSQELSEQAGACRVAYDELEVTQRGQLDYMRRIAHELKSPLSAISMTLRAAVDSLPEPIPQKQHDMIMRASQRAVGALQLTDDLLTLSQLKETARTEELTEVSLSHLIENLVAEEEPVAQQQGVALRAEIEHGLPLVPGYRSELIAMLRNLVSNAVKYSLAEGEVTIRAHSEPGSVVVVEVEDHGIGIAEEELPRVFEEFYRTASVRKAGITGTGLGLAIVKSVVEHHHGEVIVRSEPGQGTTFRVRLPASPPAAIGR